MKAWIVIVGMASMCWLQPMRAIAAQLDSNVETVPSSSDDPDWESGHDIGNG